jgi:endonuclease I|tara:strand:- start:3843 stop:5450 length:1608 start_codon:yes stop_codon:yes gene_type:complete
MRIFALALILISAFNSVEAQSLNFGSVNEKTIKKDTAFYTISGPSNPQWIYVMLMEQKPYEGVKLLYDSIQSMGGTNVVVAIPLEFAPKQNMPYLGLLTVESKNSLIGTYKLSGQGVFSNTYYSSTQNKSAEVLKTTLKTITGQGYKSLGYSIARDNMYASIDNVGGNVECVYTGKKAKFNTRSGANSASFNCEHTFPQGFFSSAAPMKSDIHHLFPTTTTSNSRRGNDPFGLVSSPSWSDGGSKSGGGKFEPRDVHKGTVARSMLYFGVRYGDYSGHLAGQESLLRSWVNQFPVSSKDIKRNNDIFSLQKNRNPFVDYPQFLERISSITGTASDAKITSFEWSKSLRHQSGDTASGWSEVRSHIIYNTGNTNVTIDEVFISGTNNSNKVLKGRNGVVLKPNESFEIEVELGADFVDGGWYESKDSLIIKTNITGQKRLAFLHALWFDTGSSLTEYDSENNLNVFPNPVLDNLYLDLGEITSPAQIRILDLQGKTVWIQSKNLEQVDVNALPSGEYLIRIEDEKGLVKSARFLKY